MIKIVTDPNGRNHKITVDDELSFLVPFLSLAKRAGIPIWKITKITGYVVPESKVEKQYASIRKQKNNKFTINILKKRQVFIGDQRAGMIFVGYIPVDSGSNFESTLDTFAHELSHIVEWDHTGDRLILQARLMLRFTKLAKKRGYTGYDG